MTVSKEDMIVIPADPDDPEDFDTTESVLQHALAERRERLVGLQLAPTKQQVKLRLDRDILARFRETGVGWQSRINAALRSAAP